MLSKWLIEKYNVSLDTTGIESGGELVTALCKAMADTGRKFDKQKEILLEATDVYCETSFVEACLNRIEENEKLQKRLDKVRKGNDTRRKNDGIKQRGRQPAAEYARLRFAPAWTLNDTSARIVHDMLKQMAAQNFFDPSPETLRSLRLGFGYPFAGEDQAIPRKTVRWLSNNNALHYWIFRLLDKRGSAPLIMEGEGGQGCWVIAANLFADHNGNAYYYEQLEHGRPASDNLRKTIDSLIPKPPSSVAILRKR